MNIFKFDLGIVARSNINGFEGMITSRAEHLYGCNRYWIEPMTISSDGTKKDGYWFDEQELSVIKTSTDKPENVNPGGFPSRIK